MIKHQRKRKIIKKSQTVSLMFIGMILDMESVKWICTLCPDNLSMHEYDYELFSSSILVNECLKHLCAKELKCY